MCLDGETLNLKRGEIPQFKTDANNKIFAILRYFSKIRKERANKRDQEKKKGIIETHYIVKTERMLVYIFIVAIIFTGGCTIGSIMQRN